MLHLDPAPGARNFGRLPQTASPQRKLIRGVILALVKVHLIADTLDAPSKD